MTSASLRDRLLETIEAARAKEASLVALCDDLSPAEEGVWTAKDNVAHLSTWREHAAQTLDAVRLGQPVDGPAHESDLDERNAEIYEEHRRETAAEVRAAANDSYATLVAAVNACSDADLRRERPVGAGEVWRVVVGNGHSHVAQHLSYWAADHDDPAGAEAAAQWAYKLDIELLPETRSVADYNLACFFARNGRAEEALPLLGAALRSRPDLRPFALDDVDLEPIRDDPRVQSLLGS